VAAVPTAYCVRPVDIQQPQPLDKHAVFNRSIVFDQKS